MTINANPRELKIPEGAGVQWTPLPQAEAPTDLERRPYDRKRILTTGPLS